MRILEAVEICSGYGEMEILQSISVHLARREMVVIIGPNGAGKSTLMKTIFGLLVPTHGSVCLLGEDITGLRPDKIVRMGMCYVPQDDNVFPSLTVQENLEMGAYIRNDDYTPSLEAVYRRFHVLDAKRKQRAGSLSGGERQMLALGKALMLDPQVLMLDEPSAGLAPRLVGEIFDKVREIAESGVGVMIIEQNAKAALKLADRGYVMVMGQIRMEDSGQALLEKSELGGLYLGT